jgi:hypothetical protein
MREKTFIIVVLLSVTLLLTRPIKVKSIYFWKPDGILVIDDDRRLAFFGWWSATQICDARIWDLFGRTIDWAVNGHNQTAHQNVRIVLFTYSGDLDPAKQSERDCIAFYEYLLNNGFEAKNIEVHNPKEMGELPVTYYKDFDLVLYTTKYSWISCLNIINSSIPFITVSVDQTGEMGFGRLSPDRAWYEGYGDTFVVADRTYYPTKQFGDGFLICGSAMNYSCILTSESPPCSCLVKAWQPQTPEKYAPPFRTGFMYVLVNSTIYPSIKDCVSRYAGDVQTGLGIEVRVNSLSTSSPTGIKTMLREAGPSLRGCIFIGDIAPAWFKYTDSRCTPPKTYEFPTDFFYMDLDGIWTDVDKDGKYEQYPYFKELTFEIWVSRLNGSVDEIKNYLDRDHAYRMGNISYPRRALVYKDDDWVPDTLTSETMIAQIYSNLTLILDKATTCRANYLRTIAEGWSIVHIWCHGSNDGHTFKVPDPSTRTSVWEALRVSTGDYELLRPQVLFYNLYTCDGARFTSSPCLGYSCIYSGALAIAGQTTKGIGMVADEYFYNLLSQGRTFGEAFREGYNQAYAQCPLQEPSPSFLGEVLLGDPTLILKEYPPVVNFSYSPNTPWINKTVSFNASSSFSPNGNITSYTWDFGDGNVTTLTEPIINHAYNKQGKYTVTLNVTDSKGLWNTASSTVTVRYQTDLNGDGRVDIRDIAIVAMAYGRKSGDPKWNAIADVNGDGIVNILDVSFVAKDYGKST